MAAQLEKLAWAAVVGPPELPGVLSKQTLAVVVGPERPGLLNLFSLAVVLEPYTPPAIGPRSSFLSFGA